MFGTFARLLLFLFAVLSSALHVPSHARWNTTAQSSSTNVAASIGKGTNVCHLPLRPPDEPVPAGTINGEIDIRWYATNDINMHLLGGYNYNPPIFCIHIYTDQPVEESLINFESHDLTAEHPAIMVEVNNERGYDGTVTFTLLEGKDGMEVKMAGEFGGGEITPTIVYYDMSDSEDEQIEPIARL